MILYFLAFVFLLFDICWFALLIFPASILLKLSTLYLQLFSLVRFWNFLCFVRFSFALPSLFLPCFILQFLYLFLFAVCISNWWSNVSVKRKWFILVKVLINYLSPPSWELSTENSSSEEAAPVRINLLILFQLQIIKFVQETQWINILTMSYFKDIRNCCCAWNQ